MKKILRSVIWSDVSERDLATQNLRATRPDRLRAPKPGDLKVLEQALDFLQKHGEAPQLKAVIDHFEQANDATALTSLEEAALEAPYHGAGYHDLFEREVEQQATTSLVETLRTAQRIATQGDKIGTVTLKGPDAAVEYLFSEAKGKPNAQTNNIPASLSAASKPLSDLLQARKNNPHQTYGVLTGYGLFDSSTAGIRKKQLYLHAGFGGHLKSTHMLNMVVNAAVDGGWNPLVFTSEMPAEELMLMLVAIHSGNPKFSGQGRPLPAFRLLLGAMNQDEQDFFELVKEDLTTNQSYGSIRVIDSSEFTTFGTIVQRVQREHAETEVDILWVDYLTRLPVDAKYSRMEITAARNETLADAKRFAMSFDKGRGLAVCSPFQVNREGYKKAKQNAGKMDKTALAQYNAAEKEADIITYIFFDAEEEATSEPKIGILKSRWGKITFDPVPVFIDPDCRRIIDLSAGMSAKTGYAPTASGKGAGEEVEL